MKWCCNNCNHVLLKHWWLPLHILLVMQSRPWTAGRGRSRYWARYVFFCQPLFIDAMCITLHYITSDAMCILVTRNRRSSSRSRWWSCPPRTFRHGSAGSLLNHPIPLPILYVTFLLINRNWWEATTTIWISVHFFFRCMEEGAEDFLLKPVRPSDISRITTRMLHWSVATTVVRLSIVFCSYSGRSDRVYSE